MPAWVYTVFTTLNKQKYMDLKEVTQLAETFFEPTDTPNEFVFSEDKQKAFLRKVFPKTNWSE